MVKHLNKPLVYNRGQFEVLVMKKQRLTDERVLENDALKRIFTEKKQELGITQASLARDLEISQGAVSLYLNGINPLNPPIASAFAQILQVPVSAFSVRLSKEIDRMAAVAEKRHIRSGMNNVTATGYHLNRVPVISWVRAGEWRDIEHYDCEDTEYIQITKAIKDGFALRVQGDSMQPEFADGDIIVIDPHAPQDNNSYVVAIHDDKATFKKLVFDGETPYLKPLNPQYPLLSWDEDTRIVGVVKQKIKIY